MPPGARVRGRARSSALTVRLLPSPARTTPPAAATRISAAVAEQWPLRARVVPRRDRPPAVTYGLAHVEPKVVGPPVTVQPRAHGLAGRPLTSPRAEGRQSHACALRLGAEIGDARKFDPPE